jgi:hypothetical protein
MKVRNTLENIYEWIYKYNLFVPEDDEYDDDDEEKDPMKIIERQQYATRLYIPLLISKFYHLSK